MSDFVKPRHLIIDAIPYLKEIMGNGLVKDLSEDEEICPVCHGTGLMINDAPYGLSDDSSRHYGSRFPYKYQTIVSCENCYNGIVHKCQYCGKLLNRNITQCDCEDVRSNRETLRIQKTKEIEQERIRKATLLNYDNLKVQEFDMLYSDLYTYNEGFFYDWNDFFVNWEENHKENDDKRPKFVYGTSLTSIGFDVDWLIDDACEELHEDAQEQISNQDREELQQLLDKWCNKQTGTKTYYEDYKYAIKIPWELYDNKKNE